MRASQGLGRLWVINRKAHCEPFWSAFGWRIVDQWRHSHPAPERRLSLVEAIGHAAARAVRGTRGMIRPRALLRPLGAADGTIGVGRVARARPGYTIEFGFIS